MFRIGNDLDYDEFLDLYELQRRSAHTLRRVFSIVLLALWVIFMLYALIMCVYMGSLLSVVILALIAFMIYSKVTRKKNYAVRMTKNRESFPLLSAEICTEDGGLRLEGSKYHAFLRYSWIKRITHGLGIYLLWHSRTQFVTLPERCFTEGDPAAFGSFIEEKTGLKLKEIK